MSINHYEEMLTGGHPNSLGNTLIVVDDVLSNKENLDNLYQCYFSHDAVVRLRVSNAFKRICKEKPGWVAEYIDKFINEISNIDQASTKWTLATLFLLLKNYMSSKQKAASIKIMKNNLHYPDWIVQNITADTLAVYAENDVKLKQWLIPELKKLSKGKYKSVARRSDKLISRLSEIKY